MDNTFNNRTGFSCSLHSNCSGNHCCTDRNVSQGARTDWIQTQIQDLPFHFTFATAAYTPCSRIRESRSGTTKKSRQGVDARYWRSSGLVESKRYILGILMSSFFTYKNFAQITTIYIVVAVVTVFV